jgi:hypothetical protein
MDSWSWFTAIHCVLPLGCIVWTCRLETPTPYRLCYLHVNSRVSPAFHLRRVMTWNPLRVKPHLDGTGLDGMEQIDALNTTSSVGVAFFLVPRFHLTICWQCCPCFPRSCASRVQSYFLLRLHLLQLRVPRCLLHDYYHQQAVCD